MNKSVVETKSQATAEKIAHTPGLIAAAPEQNQALKDIISMCEDPRGHTLQELIEDVIPSIARAAISKAEGM